jgi:hypothetical protein
MKTITIRLPDVEAAMLVVLQRKAILPRDVGMYLCGQIRNAFEKDKRRL